VWPWILTHDLNLRIWPRSVKLNQHSRHLGQRSFVQKLFPDTHRLTCRSDCSIRTTKAVGKNNINTTNSAKLNLMRNTTVGNEWSKHFDDRPQRRGGFSRRRKFNETPTTRELCRRLPSSRCRSYWFFSPISCCSMGPTTSKNCPMPLVYMDLHLINCSFWAHPSKPPQTASRSVHPFLHGLRTWQTYTDRLTDTPTDPTTLLRL